MPSMHCTTNAIVLARNAILQQPSSFIEDELMRHHKLLKNAKGEIDSCYHQCSNFDKNSDHVKNRLYNTSRRADNVKDRLYNTSRRAEKICEMISQMIKTMVVKRNDFCSLKRYSPTKIQYQLQHSLQINTNS